MSPLGQKPAPLESRPAAAPRRDARNAYRGIGLTMVLSFTVTFTCLLWNQRAARIPLPAIPAAPRESLRASTASPAAEIVGPSSTAAVAGAPADSVPVTVRIRNFRHEGRVEGSVQSLSPTSLNVFVVGSDRHGRQIGALRLSLAPFETKPFGSDEGLDLQPGGQVLVQSQGYRDRQVGVR
jgi:hypothetical protein